MRSKMGVSMAERPALAGRTFIWPIFCFIIWGLSCTTVVSAFPPKVSSPAVAKVPTSQKPSTLRPATATIEHTSSQGDPISFAQDARRSLRKETRLIAQSIGGIKAKAAKSVLPVRRWKQVLQKSLSVGLGTLALAIFFFVVRMLDWASAAARIRARPLVFALIPLLAGVCNAVTNHLAVWMMFHPLKFWGMAPGGHQWLGWQGIVPRHVRRMGTDISLLLLYELLDVTEILQKVNPETFAQLLIRQPGKTVKDSDNLTVMCKGIVLEELQAYYPWLARVAPRITQAWVTPDRLERIVASIVRKVQADVMGSIDLQHQIVESMAENPQLIVDLFKTCGRDELRFMVTSGLWGGALLGLGQMISYALLPKPWTLVVGGAFVGYATDTLALKMMFSPVEPVKILGRQFQGLFLQRQVQVSQDFATFAQNELLTPEALWHALLTGPRRNSLLVKAQEAILEELPKALQRNPAVRATVDRVATQILESFTAKYSTWTPTTYSYLHDRLELQPRIEAAVQALPSAKFERMLHPVFESDEAILIAVGSALGGLVGLAQAVL